jgi:hypothetical protein
MEQQEHLTISQPEYSTTNEQLKNHIYAHIAELTFNQAAKYIEHWHTTENFSRTKSVIKTLEEIRQELALLLSKTIDRHIISANLRNNQRDSVRHEIANTSTILDYAFAESMPLTYGLANVLEIQYQDNLHGLRLLHLAISKGNVDLVNWLLEQARAQQFSTNNLVNLPDAQSRTPLDYAYALRHFRDNVQNLDAMINLLQQHGCARSC